MDDTTSITAAAAATTNNALQSFALTLFRILYHSGQNLIVSPYSLVSALTMLLAGTGDKAESRAELVRALFGGKLEDTDTLLKQFGETNQLNAKQNEDTFKFANMLYSHQQYKIHEEYVQVLRKHFSAVAKQLDFVGEQKTHAIRTINTDVSQATNGMIDSLIDDIDPETRVILVNAIYFKGLWAKQFSVGDTTLDGVFHKSDGTKVTVPLMHKRHTFAFYHDEERSKAKYVRLDYQQQGGSISMVVILPDETTLPIHKFIEKSLTVDTLNSAIDSMGNFTEINLTLPRFKISNTHTTLTSALQTIGIRKVFGHEAELHRISPQSPQLYLSDVIQKAVIEVNEEGTKAAAATGLMMRCMMMPPEDDFTADRPFVFALIASSPSSSSSSPLSSLPSSSSPSSSSPSSPNKNSNRQILFIGAVEDPTK